MYYICTIKIETTTILKLRNMDLIGLVILTIAIIIGAVGAVIIANQNARRDQLIDNA